MRRLVTLASAAAVAAGVLATPVGALGATDRPDTLRAARASAPVATGTWLRDTLSSTSDRDFFHVRLATAARVLVTLGHLPGDYALNVYDDTGARVARSDRSGTKFEQLYRALAAGDYYVRVSTSHAVDPDVAYALKIRPLRPAVVFAEYRRIRGFDGFGVRGELLNNTARWMDVQHIRVTYLDDRGTELGIHDEGIRPGPVAPRRRAEFEIAVPARDVPDGTTRFRLDVAAQSTDTRTPAGVVLKAGTPVETNGQRLYPGTVTNTSDQTITQVWPTVVEYDSYGRAIAFGYAHIRSLAPGASRSYTAAINTKDLPARNAFREFAAVYSTA